MKRHHRESRYMSRVTVHVHDLYALMDMCRYDRCYPESEAESQKIQNIARHEVKPGDPLGYVVRLIRCAPTNDPPTDGRWRSFGCRVLDYRSTQEPAITDRELQALLLLPENQP